MTPFLKAIGQDSLWDESLWKEGAEEVNPEWPKLQKLITSELRRLHAPNQAVGRVASGPGLSPRLADGRPHPTSQHRLPCACGALFRLPPQATTRVKVKVSAGAGSLWRPRLIFHLLEAAGIPWFPARTPVPAPALHLLSDPL